MVEIAEIKMLGQGDIPGHTIVRKIGDGGMAIVYLAMQDSLKRHVALKVLRAQVRDDPEVADRFMHEAKTIAQLDHPGIVSIHEVGHTPSGKLFYSMPFLDHGDLRSFAYDDQRDLIELMQRLCDALAYAHAQGVVHRDIKPENVLFDRFGNALIADFGIALSQGNRRWTKEGHVVGSANYMSPEQSQAREVDARSDIYSLGIILYELLIGRAPYDNDDDVAILVSHVSAPLPSLPAEKRQWQRLIRRCLAKSPDDRYQSAEALKQALGEVHLSGLRRILTCWSVGIEDWYLRWRRTMVITAALLVTAAIAATAVYVHLRRSRPPPVVVSMPATASTPEAVSAPVPVVRAPATVVDEPPAFAADTDPDPDSMAIETLVVDDPVALAEASFAAAETVRLLDEAFERLARDRLTKPAGDNAADRLVTVLQGNPNHPRALQGMAELSDRYATLAANDLARQAPAEAGEYAVVLAGVWRRAGVRGEQFPEALGRVESALSDVIAAEGARLDRERANVALAAVAAVFEGPRLVSLQRQVAAIPGLGDSLSDARGMTTLFIPRGLTHVDGRTRTIETGFAVTAREVTRGEYANFASQRSRSETACRHKRGPPSLLGGVTWQRPADLEQTDNHPVVCVSWQDAMAYAEWMSARSGNIYRLPSEEEWLHMAWVGHDAGTACETGNVAGTETAALRYIDGPLDCDDGFAFTAPVGAFQPNRLGVFDLRGNVREWTMTCAATESSASRWLDRLNVKEADRCERRAVRGTGWVDGLGTSMMAQIDLVDTDHAYTYVGFRLVRDLAAERGRSQQGSPAG